MKYTLTILLTSLLLVSCSLFPQNNTPPKNIPTDTPDVADTGDTQDDVDPEDDIFWRNFSSTVTGTTVNQWELKGYYVKPKQNAENAPWIVMIHEWWGLNENIKYMADLLANEGYQVFAMDLYGEVATTREKAGELAGVVRANPDAAVAKMKQAVAYLKEQGKATKVASLGWCFGGQQSLNLSLAEKLDATVIYYGTLVTDKEKLKNISAPVLGVFGQDDTSVKPETAQEFMNALDDLEIENDVYIYTGVGHAFANPTGDNFSKPETLDAWDKTVKFLEENLKS